MCTRKPQQDKTMSSHVMYSSIEEATKELTNSGYETIDNKFWFLPNTHKWAYILGTKVFFFINQKKKDVRVATIVPPTAGQYKTKPRKKKELVHG